MIGKAKILFVLLFFFFAGSRLISRDLDYIPADLSLTNHVIFLNGSKASPGELLNAFKIDFDFQRIGTISSIPYTIINNNSKDFRIKNISISQNDSSFSFTENLNFPISVKSGSKFDLSVYFKPSRISRFTGTLTIEFDLPFNYKINVDLAGSSLAYSIVWVPTLKAYVGTEGYKIPIYAKLMDRIQNPGYIKYLLSVEINSELFYPTGVSIGTITENKVIDGKRIVTIEAFTDNLSQSETLINNIYGMVLMGSTDFSRIEIKEFTWLEDWIVPLSENGSIFTEGVCQNTVSLVKFYNRPSVSIYPNPSSDHFNLNCENLSQGNCILKLVNLSGETVYTSIIRMSRNTDNFYISFDNIKSGYYYSILETPTGTFSNQICIVR